MKRTLCEIRQATRRKYKAKKRKNRVVRVDLPGKSTFAALYLFEMKPETVRLP